MDFPSAGELSELNAARVVRSQRMKLAIFTSLLTKPLAVITPLVIVRLFVPYLGPERYGLFESVAALAIWLGVTNLGMTLGLMNKLTECHVSGDVHKARTYVSSLTLMLLGSGFLACVLWTIVTPLVDWQVLLPAREARARAEVPWAVLIAGWSTLIGLATGIPITVYTAYQEMHRANLWDGAAKLATLVACLLVVRTSWGLVGVVLATTATGVIVRLPNMLTMFLWEKPWLAPHWRYFDRTALLQTMKHGLGLFIVGVSAAAIFQTDKLIISTLLGAEAVTGYAIVGRLFLMVLGLYMLVLGPLWPAYGEALRRGDHVWVRRALRRSSLLGCVMILGCGAVMLVWGDRILALWTKGDRVEVSRSLVLALTSMFLLWTWVSGVSIVLNAAGIVRAQAKFIGLHAVLNAILAVILTKRYGVAGVAWAMAITGLLTTAWGYPWLIRKHVFARAAVPGTAVPPPGPVVA